jgi:hypothetical protein
MMPTDLEKIMSRFAGLLTAREPTARRSGLARQQLCHSLGEFLVLLLEERTTTLLVEEIVQHPFAVAAAADYSSSSGGCHSCRELEG